MIKKNNCGWNGTARFWSGIQIQRNQFGARPYRLDGQEKVDKSVCSPSSPGDPVIAIMPSQDSTLASGGKIMKFQTRNNTFALSKLKFLFTWNQPTWENLNDANFKNLQKANPWHANYAVTWSSCTSETCAVQDASRPEMSAVTILYITKKFGSNCFLKVSGFIRSQKLKNGYPEVSGSCNDCKSRAGHWGPNDLWAPLLPRQACHVE